MDEPNTAVATDPLEVIVDRLSQVIDTKLDQRLNQAPPPPQQAPDTSQMTEWEVEQARSVHTAATRASNEAIRALKDEGHDDEYIEEARKVLKELDPNALANSTDEQVLKSVNLLVGGAMYNKQQAEKKKSSNEAGTAQGSGSPANSKESALAKQMRLENPSMPQEMIDRMAKDKALQRQYEADGAI